MIIRVTIEHPDIGNTRINHFYGTYHEALDYVAGRLYYEGNSEKRIKIVDISEVTFKEAVERYPGDGMSIAKQTILELSILIVVIVAVLTSGMTYGFKLLDYIFLIILCGLFILRLMMFIGEKR